MGHRSQGTAPNRTGASSVGQKVGRKASRMPVRQHVSCGCIECGLLKGQDTYCDVCSSAAHHTVRIHASHLPGAQNTAADALSRNRILEFLQVVPEAEREPTALPQSDRPDGQGTAQLDLTTLDQTVQQLLQAGLATSMQCSYMAGKRKFLSFCHDSNTSPLPLTNGTNDSHGFLLGFSWISTRGFSFRLTASHFRALSGPTEGSNYLKHNWSVECCFRG